MLERVLIILYAGLVLLIVYLPILVTSNRSKLRTVKLRSELEDDERLSAEVGRCRLLTWLSVLALVASVLMFVLLDIFANGGLFLGVKLAVVLYFGLISWFTTDGDGASPILFALATFLMLIAVITFGALQLVRIDCYEKDYVANTTRLHQFGNSDYFDELLGQDVDVGKQFVVQVDDMLYYCYLNEDDRTVVSNIAVEGTGVVVDAKLKPELEWHEVRWAYKRLKWGQEVEVPVKLIVPRVGREYGVLHLSSSEWNVYYTDTDG